MLPPIDITYIAEELDRHAEELIVAFEDQGGDAGSDPRVLLLALKDLFDSLRGLDDAALSGVTPDGPAPSALLDIRALGDHGIDLLARLSATADELRLPQQTRAIEELTLPFACWTAYRGGELSYLEPVVNGAASLANRLDKPSELGQLCGLLTDVIDAVNPDIPQESTSTDPRHPWRTLLINRAIVATRSHQTSLMEESFASIIEYLPNEAPAFFSEGMEQMDALGYPERVRAVMQRFYDQWCGQRVLH